jgi:hypothetical protein
MFTGNEDHTITSETAAELIRRYMPIEVPTLMKAEYYSRTALEEVLAQQDVVGIRVYYAKSDILAPTVVVVGVKADGSESEDIYLNSNKKCPPSCK